MLPRFDFHIHTNYSDGTVTPATVIESALGRNLEAVAITDHGPEHQDGILVGRIDQMIEDVKVARENLEFLVLLGMEANIVGPQGSLDIEEKVLDELDLALAGVHSPETFKQVPEAAARDYFTSTMNAIKNQEIDVLAHPFCLYDDLSPYLSSEDLRAFAKAAADRKVAIELNERYHAPSEKLLAICVDEGVKVSVGSDAHAPSEVGNLKWASEMLELFDVKEDDLVLESFF